MESLPSETISNILARLSVKDVTRFKLVNKPWHALISSNHFAHLHFNRNNLLHHRDDDRIIIFIGEDDGCLYFINVEDLRTSLNPKKINFNYSLYKFKYIVGSCNGLVLCMCYVEGYEGLNLVLVNPSTLQHKLISKSGLLGSSDDSSCYGVGYDANTDDYKVVRIVPMKSENGKNFHQVAIYSLNSNTWKFINQNCLSSGKFSNRFGVLINKNSTLHWAFYSLYSRVIKSFDVCTEQWSEVSLPKDLIMYVNIPLWPKAHLRSVDGRLCLSTEGGAVYRVFLMETYGVQDSWVNLIDDYMIPMLYSKSSDEFLIFGMPGYFFWFSPTHKGRRRVVMDNNFDSYDAAPCVYFRSLVQIPL